MHITVLGAGAWGTAMAISASLTRAHERQANQVVLWARKADQAQEMAQNRCNARYLPHAQLPDNLHITADLTAAIKHAQAGLYIIATPMSGLGGMLQVLPTQAAIVWLCKGFEANTGYLGHEIARIHCPQAQVGVLSGPSFAAEVGEHKPTALVIASQDAELRQLTVQALHSHTMRIYTSPDIIGVEVGGAVKNVLAIATGIADGMQLGLNARAALITRGLAEMSRLGQALGAQTETFMGLSGLGDLVLTATGDLSRNRKVGLQLAKGLNLPQILTQLGHVSEGVYSAATVLQRARQLGLDMPITEAVVNILDQRLSPAEGLLQLMRREARSES